MTRGKLALFGCNQLSLEVARRLVSQAYTLVVVDADDSRLEKARNLGFAVECVDPMNDDDLKSIGVGTTISYVFCMLPRDSQNVFLTISVRDMDPRVRIVSIAHSSDAGHKLLAAGADKVIDLYEITAGKITELIERPLIVDIIEQTIYGEHDLNIAEITLPENSKLDQRLLSDVQRELRHNVIILGVVDQELGNNLVFGNLGTRHKLDAGDILLIIGARREIDLFKQDVVEVAG